MALYLRSAYSDMSTTLWRLCAIVAEVMRGEKSHSIKGRHPMGPTKRMSYIFLVHSMQCKLYTRPGEKIHNEWEVAGFKIGPICVFISTSIKHLQPGQLEQEVKIAAVDCRQIDNEDDKWQWQWQMAIGNEDDKFYFRSVALAANGAKYHLGCFKHSSMKNWITTQLYLHSFKVVIIKIAVAFVCNKRDILHFQPYMMF